MSVPDVKCQFPYWTVSELYSQPGHQSYWVKESFSFKTRIPGTVKCRPTVAY